MEIPAQTARKVHWRLGVPAVLFMLFSSLDRVNISFAALGMNRDLALTPSEYGFGAGVLFIGFLAGQYPSVLWLQRVGMRRWIAACAVVWALCAGGIAAVSTPLEFYALRLVLGFAEGGLAPGIVLYLSQFATERQRARTFALPMLAIPLSLVVGSPISGGLMSIGAAAGLASWRWMLLAEAAPALLLGIAGWFYFPDGPEQASWLSPDERRWFALNASHDVHSAVANDWSVLRSPLVWGSAVLWFCLLSGSYGIMFWLPQLIKRLAGVGAVEIGWINALPWLGAMVGMYFNSAHSDRTGERYWHIALPAAVAAIAIEAAWSVGDGPFALLMLLLAGIGLGAAQGAFWALPTALLTQSTLAVAAVAINIAGSAGGAVVPHLVGYALERTGGFAVPSALISGLLVFGALLVASIRALSAPRAEQARSL